MTDEGKLRIIRLPDDFVDRGYEQAFGVTKDEAHEQRVCVMCKQYPTFSTEAGRREYEISGMCEPCWDKLMTPPDEPEEP